MNNMELVVVDCLQIPKVLFQNKKWNTMSSVAKVLYSFMLEKLELAAYNEWIDKDGKLYVIYSKRQMQNDLNCSKGAVDKAYKELKNIYHLIKVEHVDGEANHIYLSKPEENYEDNVCMVTFMDTRTEDQPDMLEEADEFGIEVALVLGVAYDSNNKLVKRMQDFLNKKYKEQTEEELMSAVETVVQIFGGSREFVDSMYACDKHIRKIFLDQFIESYNNITENIIEGRNQKG